MATVLSAYERDGVLTLLIEFSSGFCDGLAIGGSVSISGVCLTVTDLRSSRAVAFDVISESLSTTALGKCVAGQLVNVERAARDGAEIGGHPVSGHVDFRVPVRSVAEIGGNKLLRFELPVAFACYLFRKGYVAIDGASLTVAEVDREAGWLETWLIPETRRATTFDLTQAGDEVNVDIERGTQIVVDTIRSALNEHFDTLRLMLSDMSSTGRLKLEEPLVCNIKKFSKSELV